MARTQNPILGRARGSIGNAVLTKQYKHNTARSKPLSVKNPNTEKQQLVRGKMSLIGHLIMITGNAMQLFTEIFERHAGIFMVYQIVVIGNNLQFINKRTNF